MLPASVPEIEEGAFCGCESLKDENGFVIVAGILFGYFGDGGEVIVPDCVTKIGWNAFEQARGIVGLVIPSGVKSVTKESFAGISENAWIMAPYLPIEAFQTSGLKRSAALGFLKNPAEYSDPLRGFCHPVFHHLRRLCRAEQDHRNDQVLLHHRGSRSHAYHLSLRAEIFRAGLYGRRSEGLMKKVNYRKEKT
jgi:hypothetical protein